MPTSALRNRLGALAFALAGVLFILYPALRPWENEDTVDGAVEAMTSGAWIASHLFAMLGFILVALGLLALRNVVSHTRAERLAFTAIVTGWVGAGLTLPYFGAEAYGLHGIATTAAAGESFDLLATIDEVRLNPVVATTFAVGLLALGVAAILAAVAIWRSEVLPRSAGSLFALGFALFIPQFYTPAAVRIGHGVLLGVGLAWVALLLWRAAARPSAEPAHMTS